MLSDSHLSHKLNSREARFEIEISAVLWWVLETTNIDTMLSVKKTKTIFSGGFPVKVRGSLTFSYFMRYLGIFKYFTNLMYVY